MTFFEWVWKWLEKRDDERAERIAREMRLEADRQATARRLRR